MVATPKLAELAGDGGRPLGPWSVVSVMTCSWPPSGLVGAADDRQRHRPPRLEEADRFRNPANPAEVNEAEAAASLALREPPVAGEDRPFDWYVAHGRARACGTRRPCGGRVLRVGHRHQAGRPR
ncbi:hypothetical protein QJS66_23675 (plasmid) [Kocuria rhizophila]|nr:hypothetical protein QJS66_23675 [Kocuria rhizophila]